jgi:hypothetical protein
MLMLLRRARCVMRSHHHAGVVSSKQPLLFGGRSCIDPAY